MAVLPVGPAETYTTIAAALTASADVADIVELRANITESVTCTTNVAEFRSQSGSVYTWSSTGSGPNDTLDFDTGVSQLITFTDIAFDHSSGTARTIDLDFWASGFKVKFERCTFQHGSSTASAYVLGGADFAVADGVVFNRCKFDGNSTADAVVFTLTPTVANSFVFTNCIFQNHTGAGHGLEFTASDATSATILENCTFDNNGIDFETGSRGTFRNNVFTGTDNLVIDGSGDTADFTYCAFDEHTSFGGTGNIFGITRTDQYVSAGTNNYHVKNDSADIYDAGTNTGATPDYDGVSRPQATNYCIGAFEFVAGAGAATLGFGIIIGPWS